MVLNFWDVSYTIGKVFSRPFQRYIISPQISTGKTKENLQSLATAEQAGQKNCNGKTPMFSTSALKEIWAFAYYWQCLLLRIG
jgi:hypothetical protein